MRVTGGKANGGLYGMGESRHFPTKVEAEIEYQVLRKMESTALINPISREAVYLGFMASYSARDISIIYRGL